MLSSGYIVIFAIVSDKSKNSNSKIVGYVVFKKQLEKIEQVDYSHVPPSNELK